MNLTVGSEEVVVSQGDGERMLSYPVPRGAALEPPTEWARLQQRRPVAQVTLPSGDETHSCLGQALARTEPQAVLEVPLRRLPSMELDVPVEDPHRVEGLVVGGLREVPVRW
jgi:cytochrome P450